MKHKVFIFLTLIFIFSFLNSYGEALQDNEYYKKAVELLTQAKQEYTRGDYDKGYEYSEQAKEYLKQADQYNLIIILTIRLLNEKESASKAIEKAKSFEVSKNIDAKKLFDEAVKLYNESEDYYNQGKDKTDYTEKAELFKKAIENYEESRKLSNMAMSKMPESKDDAKKLLNLAKSRREELIKNKIINKTDDIKIMKIINEAQKSFDDNDYYASNLKSREAIAVIDKIELKNKAYTLLKKATNWLDKSKEKGAENDYPDKFNDANKKLEEDNDYYNNEKYDDSINISNEILAIIKSFGYNFGDIFPKYYEVRLIPLNRDCFWKIAGYSFIYNNPWKWTVIYKANKDKLKIPSNPDLIHPTIILTIPSINGEEREGTYESGIEYPVFNPTKNYGE